MYDRWEVTATAFFFLFVLLFSTNFHLFGKCGSTFCLVFSHIVSLLHFNWISPVWNSHFFFSVALYITIFNLREEWTFFYSIERIVTKIEKKICSIKNIKFNLNEKYFSTNSSTYLIDSIFSWRWLFFVWMVIHYRWFHSHKWPMVQHVINSKMIFFLSS